MEFVSFGQSVTPSASTLRAPKKQKKEDGFCFSPKAFKFARRAQFPLTIINYQLPIIN
jgi:hypothetical protein